MTRHDHRSGVCLGLQAVRRDRSLVRADRSLKRSAPESARTEQLERLRAGRGRRSSEGRSASGWASCSTSGLHYLTLDRSAPSLSGGEAQRIRLASQIGSGLVGVMYILDEPSIGLHQRDNRKLIDTLHQAARSRQHRVGGRARRRNHAGRRLDRGLRAARRSQWRRGRRRGLAGADCRKLIR